MARKIVSGIITVIAILAMGVTAFAAEQKGLKDSTRKEIIQQVPQTIPAFNATISGSITLHTASQGTLINSKNCSDIIVYVRRYTNPYQENQQSEDLLTTKATGGQIINGCSYSATVKKGPGVVVSARYPISLLGPQQGGGPIDISGYTGPFDLNANITKNIIMYMRFF